MFKSEWPTVEDRQQKSPRRPLRKDPDNRCIVNDAGRVVGQGELKVRAQAENSWDVCGEAGSAHTIRAADSWLSLDYLHVNAQRDARRFGRNCDTSTSFFASSSLLLLLC